MSEISLPLRNIFIPGRSIVKTMLEWLLVPDELKDFVVLKEFECRVRVLKDYLGDTTGVPVYLSDLN